MITICIPFYNAQNTIRDCILSILNQTYTEFNVLLIDDGSTDNSIETIKDLLDPRFTLINNKINQGLIFSLNRAVNMCKTKYIARMDADDIMHPSRLQLQFQFLEANPLIDVVDTLMVSFDDSLRILGLVKFTFLELIEKKDTIFSSPLAHATIMAKTTWYKSNTYNKEFYRAEDHELFCRTFDFSNFARIYQPLYYVRSHNINLKNYKNSLITQKLILSKYKMYLNRSQYLFGYFKIVIKYLIYTFFGFFNQQHILVSKRNKKLSFQYFHLHTNTLKSTINKFH